MIDREEKAVFMVKSAKLSEKGRTTQHVQVAALLTCALYGAILQEKKK